MNKSNSKDLTLALTFLFKQALKELFDNSLFAYSEKDNLGGQKRPDGSIHKAHPNVESFDNYVAKAEIDGEEYFVRFTVQRNKGRNSSDGLHSAMVTGVEVYKNTAGSLSLPITTRTRGTSSGVVDAKLQQFFESASSNRTNSPYDLAGSEETIAHEDEASVGYGRGQTPPAKIGDYIAEMVRRANANIKPALQDRAQAYVESMKKLRGAYSAMAAQRAYDQATVDEIVTLARDLIKNGFIAEAGVGEISRLLGAVRTALGRSDITNAANRIFDIMLGNMQRRCSTALTKLMNTRDKKVSDLDVEVQGKLGLKGHRAMATLRKAMSLEYFHPSAEDASRPTPDCLLGRMEEVLDKLANMVADPSFDKNSFDYRNARYVSTAWTPISGS